MPTRFKAFHQHSGFHETAPPLLVVPYGDKGLVKLINVKSFDIRRNLRFNQSDLTVRDVTGEADKSVMDYAEPFPVTMRDGYTAAHIRHGLSGSVLLSIEGKSPNKLTHLKYVNGRIEVPLQVYTAPWRGVTVSFRFVHCWNVDKEMKAGTTHDPSLAEKLVAFLNRYYLPATNVEFELKSALPINFDRFFGSPITQNQFTEFFIPQQDTTAEITIFFAGEYMSRVGTPGTSDPRAGCAIISDHPIEKSLSPETTWPSKSPTFEQLEAWADQRIRAEKGLPRTSSDRELHYVLAHEVGHLLGYRSHNSRDEHIMTETSMRDFKMDLEFVMKVRR